MDEMNWYSEETKPLSEISIADFEKLCETVAEQRNKIDEMSAAVKEENIKLMKLEAKVVTYLKEMGKSSYQSTYGTVGVMRRMSVKVPKTPEAREAFFNYLREINQFDNMISVNSQTLNAFYKQEVEAAEADGRLGEFSIPGLEEPTISETMSFRKAK